MKWESEESKFSKSDMDRLGFIMDLGFISIGDPYINPTKDIGCRRMKGPQMLSANTKAKDATMQGYFASEFKRPFEGECYHDAVAAYHKEYAQSVAKNLRMNFKWQGEKKDCGKGSYCATINPCPPAFSPLSKLTKPGTKDDTKSNHFYAGMPSKKGTGYGYTHLVGLSHYVGHTATPYEEYDKKLKKELEIHKGQMLTSKFICSSMPKDYFSKNPYKPYVSKKAARKLKPLTKQHKLNKIPFLPTSPAKKLAANSEGCFSRYLPFFSSKYITKGRFSPRKDVTNKTGQKYTYNDFYKSKRTCSILDINVERKVNNLNYQLTKEVMHYPK